MNLWLRRWLPGLVVLALAVMLFVTKVLLVGQVYVALLPNAAGIKPGDPVRMAGIDIGRVNSVEASGAVVRVGFSTDQRVPLTRDTVTQVKLATLLGQHYLSLSPGHGSPLQAGATLPLANADGSYTIERFWADAPGQVQALDLQAIGGAVRVLATDGRADPAQLHRALTGLTSVSTMVTRRDQEVGALLDATSSVTGTLDDQRGQLLALLHDSDQVLGIVAERRHTIALLLADSRRLVDTLTRMARRNEGQAGPLLRNAHRVLATLVSQRRQLDRVLQLAGPSMRFDRRRPLARRELP